MGRNPAHAGAFVSPAPFKAPVKIMPSARNGSDSAAIRRLSHGQRNHLRVMREDMRERPGQDKKDCAHDNHHA